MNKYFLVVLLSLFMQAALSCSSPLAMVSGNKRAGFQKRQTPTLLPIYGYRKAVNKSVPSSSGNTI